MAGRTEERDRMRQLLVEAISTLCRSGLHYSSAMRVEGLLAITLDEQDILVVNVNKTYESQCNKSKCVSPTVGETKDIKDHMDQCDIVEEKSHMPAEISQETFHNAGHKRTLPATHSKSPAKRKKSQHGSEEAVHNLTSPCSPTANYDSSRDSNFSGSLHPVHSDNEQNQLSTQIPSSSSHPYGSKPTSTEEPQIKIEINSDSDCDVKEGVLEDLNLIFSGQNELVPVSESHRPEPVSMFGENGQPLPVPSGMLLLPASASGASYQQPAPASMQPLDQSVQTAVQQATFWPEKYDNLGTGMQVVPKGRGVVLMYNGYAHRRDRIYGNKLHWRCSFPQCKGRVHCVIIAGKMEVVAYKGHCHPPT